jgi:hypothetical protein
LPPVQNSTYDDISASVGFTATVILLVWFSKQHLYVPRQAQPSHPLATLIGLPALRALVRDFGGEQLWLPEAGTFGRYARDRDVAVRLSVGDSTADVAKRFDLSERRVEQLRAELIENGILKLAEGRRRSCAPGRPRDGRSPFEDGLKILGTGEVSGDTPLPA